MGSKPSIPTGPVQVRVFVVSGSTQGRRPTMEDTHTKGTLKSHPHISYYAVFDGHGGREAADFCKAHMASIIDTALHERCKEAHCKFTGPHPNCLVTVGAAACTEAFLEVDRRFLLKKIDAGCTVALVLLDTVNLQLLAANVGDAETILSRNGQADDLFEIHKPDRPLEKQRIERGGFRVKRDRIMSDYAAIGISRAIGDPYFKRFVAQVANDPLGLEPKNLPLSAIPYTTTLSLSTYDSVFVVIACDGLFESLPKSQEVVDWVISSSPSLKPSVFGRASIQAPPQQQQQQQQQSQQQQSQQPQQQLQPQSSQQQVMRSNSNNHSVAPAAPSRSLTGLNGQPVTARSVTGLGKSSAQLDSSDKMLASQRAPPSTHPSSRDITLAQSPPSFHPTDDEDLVLPFDDPQSPIGNALRKDRSLTIVGFNQDPGTPPARARNISAKSSPTFYPPRKSSVGSSESKEAGSGSPHAVRNPMASKLAQQLAEHAVAKGSNDNVSVMILAFDFTLANGKV